MTAVETNGSITPAPSNTGGMSTGQKVGVGAGIAVLVALAAEASRRLYNKRVKERADTAAAEAAAATHLKEVEDLRQQTVRLQQQLDALLAAKVEQAAGAKA